MLLDKEVYSILTRLKFLNSNHLLYKVQELFTKIPNYFT